MLCGTQNAITEFQYKIKGLQKGVKKNTKRKKSRKVAG